MSVVTGPNTYRFMKLQHGLDEFQVISTLLRPPKETTSTDYSCHAWTRDMKLVVCTAAGDVMLVNRSGEFLMYLPESPEGKQIDSITIYSQGFILGGSFGYIWTFAV